jgi:hypothetical protein
MIHRIDPPPNQTIHIHFLINPDCKKKKNLKLQATIKKTQKKTHDGRKRHEHMHFLGV